MNIIDQINIIFHQAGLKVQANQTGRLRLEGATVPVSARVDNQVDLYEFDVLMGEWTYGVLIFSVDFSKIGCRYKHIVRVSNRDGIKIELPMENLGSFIKDEYYIQTVGAYLELQIVGGRRYTDNPKGGKKEMYVVPTQAIADYANGMMTDRALQNSVSKVPETEYLRSLLKKQEREIVNLALKMEAIVKERSNLKNELTRQTEQLKDYLKMILHIIPYVNEVKSFARKPFCGKNRGEFVKCMEEIEGFLSLEPEIIQIQEEILMNK